MEFDGCAGFDSLGGDFPRCPITLTANGGYHLYFKQPSDRAPLTNSTGRLPKGIDVRGCRGQVIAPGSVKRDGAFYDAVAGWPDLTEAFAAGTIPEIPAWLIGIIEAGKSVDAGGPCGGSQPAANGDKSAWVAEALYQEAHALAATGEGGRNHALNKFVATFAGHTANGWTTRDEVYAAAYWACTINGYLQSRDASDGPQQFRKTFESGWRWGFAHPTRGPRERTSSNEIFFEPRTASVAGGAK